MQKTLEEIRLKNLKGFSQCLRIMHDFITDQELALSLEEFFEMTVKVYKYVVLEESTLSDQRLIRERTAYFPIFFCDVYASWQEGGIENMNGRLRRDLPRKTDLFKMSDEELEQILLGHNLTPKKVLNGVKPPKVGPEESRELG